MKTSTKIIIISLAAVFFVALDCLVSIDICKRYYTTNYYSFDPVDGLLKNIESYERFKNYGRADALVNQLKNNPKTPFAVVPIIAFAPQLLKNPYGHLIITFPFFAFFLILYGILLIKRGYDFSLTLLLMFSYCCIWSIYGTYSGIAFNLPDVIASYPLAISILVFLLWRTDKKNVWLVLMAAMICLSFLIRYIYSVYAFILLTPLLCWAMFSDWRESRDVKKSVLFPLLIISSIVTVVCSYLLIRNFEYNFGYYSTWANIEGATMNFDRWFSLKAFLQRFFSNFGRFHQLIIFILLLLQAWTIFKSGIKNHIENLFISFWLIIGLPILWVCILGTNGFKVGSIFLTLVPIFWITVTALSNIKFPSSKGLKYIVYVFVLLLSVVHAYRSYNTLIDVTRNPSAESVDVKNVTKTIAGFISNTTSDRHVLSDLTGLYLAEAVVAESMYLNDIPIHFIPNGVLFSPEENFWALNGRKQKIVNDAMITLERDCNWIIVTEPDTINMPSVTARYVVKNITKELNSSPDWQRIEVLSNHGAINVFHKSSSSLRQ